jgi:4-hydroxybenzoate polyprenyltransferase
VDRPIGTWLLLIPCWWGLLIALLYSDGSLLSFDTFWIAFVCLAGSVLMRGAGCTWNDITDKDLDAQVARSRSRPLASGLVSLRASVMWLIFQLILSGMLLVTLSWFAIGVGIFSLLLVVIYPFAKRFTWWPQIFLGLAFNWGILLSWGAYIGSLNLIPIFLYVSGICWTLFYDTIYAHQDKQDDMMVGIKSTALRLGEQTKSWLYLFLFGVIVFNLLSLWQVFLKIDGVVAFIICCLGTFAMGLHLFFQIRKLDIHNPENCLILFRSNRDTGIIFIVALCIAVLIKSGSTF